jgi:tRNA (mo5U34)-methyltransferase
LSTERATADADVRRRVSEIDWFHRIELRPGLVTPGIDDTPAKWKALQMPPLAGKSVLDVGANNGYFSFAAEREGAARIVAVDAPAWGDAAWGSKDGFNFAREALGSKVQDVHSDLYALSPDELGTFDVVLMLGVLYHVEDPILALRRMAALTNELLVLETLVDLTLVKRPAAALYPTIEMGRDETNWWGPNAAAVLGMLRAAGFRRAELVGRRSVASRLGHLMYNVGNVAHSRRAQGRIPLPWSYVQTDRAVFHAYR